MGEAMFYLKARFPSKEHLAKAFHDIKKFLDEGVQAEDQESAEDGSEFANRFPLVKEYLDAFATPDDALSALAQFPREDMERQVRAEGGDLLVSGMVWHLADWDPLCKFLKTKFGAEACGWLSDESPLDYFALIEME